MRVRPFIWTLSVFLFSLSSVADCQAALVLYSDRSDFNAATGGLFFQGFNGGFEGGRTNLSYPRVSLRIERYGEPFRSATNPRVVSEGPRSIQYYSRNLDTKVTFNFSIPINAFGIDINDWGTVDTGRLLIENNTGSFSHVIASVDPSSHLPVGNTIFFGVVDDDPFTSVTLFSDTQGDLIGLDFLVFGQASTIPEPSSLAAVALAASALLPLRYRRRSLIV